MFRENMSFRNRDDNFFPTGSRKIRIIFLFVRKSFAYTMHQYTRWTVRRDYIYLPPSFSFQ